MQTTFIEPARLTMADLEILEARETALMLRPAPPVEAAPPEKRLPPMTKRDLRQQFVGVARMINHLSGGDMREQIDNLDFMVRHINELEAQLAERDAEIVMLKKARVDDVAGYKKALRNIAARLEPYRNPFEALPFSKWKNEAKGKWMLAVGETVDWAVQRADNQLDPINAVVIAADED